MIRFASLLLILALLCGCALAEADIPAEYVLPENTEISLDLDGDGAPETLSWQIVPDDEYEEHFELTVLPGDGGEAIVQEKDFYVQGAYAVDLNGDGIVELLVSGDEASDDYITVCYHLSDGELVPALFADAFRGANYGGYFKEGYGMVTGIDGNRLTLCGSQDLLGTWFAERVYALDRTGIFEFADDGEWVRNSGEYDEDSWTYMSLKTIVELPFTDEDGQPGTLPAGMQLLITGTDKQSYARFLTRDGVTGTLEIYPDYDQPWVVEVSGIPQAECFEYIPYAD